jgi:hypothetical protein
MQRAAGASRNGSENASKRCEDSFAVLLCTSFMASQPSKERHKCVRCGRPSRARDVHHVISGSWKVVSIQLCDDCHNQVRMADAKAWKWVWTLPFDSN